MIFLPRLFLVCRRCYDIFVTFFFLFLGGAMIFLARLFLVCRRCHDILVTVLSCLEVLLG